MISYVIIIFIANIVMTSNYTIVHAQSLTTKQISGTFYSSFVLSLFLDRYTAMESMKLTTLIHLNPMKKYLSRWN
jgi:hypothetical protein